MAAVWQLVGRRAELRTIATAISDASSKGVVLAGTAGVGKTRLAQEAVAGIDHRRFEAVHAVASTASSAIPFGALAHLLPSTEETVGRLNLLGWARSAILGSVDDGRRLVMSVDDAHLLDEASAAVVLHLARASDAFILATVRSGEVAPDAVQSLWKDGLLDRVELSPLSFDDTTEMAKAVLGGDVDAATAHRLWRVTEGNPLFLREIVLAGTSGRTLARSHGVFRWTGELTMAPRLAELIGDRIGALDDDETAVLELVTFADPIGVSILAELSSPAAIEAVETRKLITVESDGLRVQVRLAHPLYGEAVRARCPELRARRRMRELAGAVEATGARRRDDTLRLAVWRLNTGTAHDPAQMLLACRIAWVATDLPLATRLGWAAINAGGGVDAVITLATILNFRERFDEAAAALASVDDVGMSSTDRARLAATRAYTVAYGRCRPDEAIQLLDDVGQSVDSPEGRLTVAAMRAEVIVVAGRGAAGLPYLDAVLAEPGIPAPVEARTLTMAALGYAHVGRRTTASAHLDHALGMIDRWRDAAPFEEPRGRFIRHLTHLLAGELDAAEAAMTGMDAQASQEWHWDLARGVVSMTHGQIARLRGRFGDTERRCRAAVVALHTTGRTFTPMCFGELAHAQALAGDGQASRESLAEAERLRSPSFELFNYWIDIARPWVVAGGGDVNAAVHDALDTANRAHDAGLVGFEVIAAHDVVRLGAADAVAERLQAAADRAEGPYPVLCAEHAAAALSGNGNGLLGVADRFARLGMLLHAAEAAAQAAATFRADGQVGRSHAAAARAWSLAQRCQGARTPALAGLRAPGLTRSESEIAHLAAAGLTSREIADRLVKSVRTVDNHLGNVYQKLGVDSRRQLADLLVDTGRSMPPETE